jgi:radical SAM superfamily enzyme YgiQ (UPF0313 family)
MSATKNILFVSANTLTNPYPVYPIGISYLYTYLGKRLPQHNFMFFDFNRHTLDEFETFLKSSRFDIIGISLRNIDDTNIFEKNCFVTWYRQILESTRKWSSAKVILGGSGFSIFPEQLFNELKPDFGIKGEGEETLLQLIENIDKPEVYTSIEGLTYKNADGKIIINPRTNFLRSLELSFDSDLLDFYWDKSGMLNIQTKRGCPYRCIYCSYPVIEGRKVRTLNPDLIVETLKDIYFNKKISYVFFTDSVFNLSDEYNFELANKIIDSGVKVSWGAYFSPNKLSRESLELYKKAGLTHIEFGTDSFSDSTLKLYGKEFTFADVLEKSLICYDLGIFHAHFLILGGYGETEKSLDEGFENSKKIPYSVFFPYVGMRIYPETKLFDIALEEGKIKGANDLLSPVYYISDEINMDTLKERAYATGKKWIFADYNDNGMIEKFRARKKRGPLWEFLRF